MQRPFFALKLHSPAGSTDLEEAALPAAGSLLGGPGQVPAAPEKKAALVGPAPGGGAGDVSGRCRSHHVGPAVLPFLVPLGAGGSAAAAAAWGIPKRPGTATHPLFPCWHLPQRHEPQPLGGCSEHLQAGV